MMYRISRNILWLFFKICFRYRVRFKENIPAGGAFILAGNHVSLLDPVAVGLVTARPAAFLVKDTLYKNKLLGWWMRAINATVPVRRGRLDLGAIKSCLELLRQGRILVLFPEGTRSGDGEIKDPKGGVGFLAAKAGVPVVPVLVKGSDKALPLHGLFVRFRPVEVLVGRPVETGHFFDKDKKFDYRAFSTQVMERIKRLN